MPPLEVPDDADGVWWDTVAVGHLHSHWPAITERFDVVIVDEAQDFSPAWLAQLEQLLDRGGPRRLMLLADAAQGVFQRGFDPTRSTTRGPAASSPTTAATRSASPSILHRHLDGATPLAGPESLGVRWREAADPDTVIELVGEEIDHIEAEGYETPTSARRDDVTVLVRDRLREAMGFSSWEQRDEHTIVCETVHRVKGLEFDFVVLVARVTVPSKCSRSSLAIWTPWDCSCLRMTCSCPRRCRPRRRCAETDRPLSARCIGCRSRPRREGCVGRR